MRLVQITCLAAAISTRLLAESPPNLIPNPGFNLDANGSPMAWQTWSPRPGLRPLQDIVNQGDGASLRVVSHDFASFGKWLTTGIAVKPGHYYQFEVLYRPEGLTDERGSVAGLLSWNKASGEPIQRDYVDQI